MRYLTISLDTLGLLAEMGDDWAEETLDFMVCKAHVMLEGVNLVKGEIYSYRVAEDAFQGYGSESDQLASHMYPDFRNNDIAA